MADQLYSQFADISALEAQRDAILKDIFGKIKAGVLDLSKTTFKIDGANSAADLKKVLEELKNKEKELAEQSKRLSDVQAQLATLMSTAANGAKTAGNEFKGFSEQLAVNLQRQIQLKDRISEIGDELKRLNEFKKVAKDSAEFNEQILKLTAEQKSLQTELAQTNRVINLQSKEISETSTEYDKASARAEQLKRTLRDLSVAGKEDTLDFTQAKAEFDELDAKIRKADVNVKDFTKNVGNYANSLQGGFERIAAEISKLKTEQGALANMKAANPIGFKIGGGEERLNQINGALQQLNATAQIGFQTTGNLNQQVRQLEKSYQNMAVSGAQSNEFLEEFKHFVAQSKDQLEDLRGEIKALSSDTFVFDQISQGVKFLAASGQIALSVMELAGDKNEDLQKSIQRLIIIQNVANGVQEIANQFAARGTVLNKAYVFVQNLVTLSLNSSATAAARFSAALGLVGIAATVIGAAVIAIAAYRRATDDAATSAGVLRKTLADSNNEYTEAVQNVNQLKINIGLAKDGFLNKNDVVKQYNETIGKTTGEVKTLDQAEQELNKNAEAYIKFTLAKAAAQLALGKAAAEALKLAQAEQTFEQDLTLATKTTRKPLQLGATDAGEAADEGTEGEKRLTAERNKVREQSNKRIKNFEDIANEFQTQAALISSQFKFNFFGDGGGDKGSSKALEDFAKDLAKIRADITKANFESLKQRRQDEINALEAITNDAKRGYHERYAASQLFYDRSKELIDLNVGYEIEAQKKATEEEKRQVQLKLKNPNLTIKQRSDLNETLKTLDDKFLSEEKLIRAKYNTAFVALDNNSEKQRTDIMKDATDRRKKILEEEQKFRDDHNKSGHEIDLQQIQNDFDTASNLLDQRFADGLISEKKYNRDKLKLEAERQTATIESEVNTTVALIEEQEKRFKIDEAELQHKIDLAKAEAALEKDPAKKKDQLAAIAEAEKGLAQARISNNDIIAQSSAKLNSLLIKLNGIRIDIFKKGNKDIKDDFIKTFSDIADAAKLSFELIGGLISASVDKQKNNIQEQIDLLDKKKQVEIEAVNQSIGSAEEKAARIKIIEARTDAERQQLETKKRQADERRARFEKAATISQIILSTALAVVKAFTEGDPYTKVARAIAAGVIGAAQLAVAVATPIPKFKTGKNIELTKQQKDNYEGPAIVGDGGKQEIIIRENGIVEITPANPTLTSVKKNDIILPDAKMIEKDAKNINETELIHTSKKINEELVQLDKRFSAGIITEEEYKTKKSELQLQLSNKKEVSVKTNNTVIEKMVPLPLFKTGKHVEEFEKIKESVSNNVTEKTSKVAATNSSRSNSTNTAVRVSEMKIVKGESPLFTTYNESNNIKTSHTYPVVFNNTLSELAGLKHFSTFNISNDMIRAGEAERIGIIRSFSPNVNVSVPDHGDKIDKQTEILKRIEAKPSTIIQANQSIELTAWFYQHFKS